MITLSTASTEVYLATDPPAGSPPCHRCQAPASLTINDRESGQAFVLCGNCLMGGLALSRVIDTLDGLNRERRERLAKAENLEPIAAPEPAHRPPAPRCTCSQCGREWTAALGATYCSGTPENPTPHNWVSDEAIAELHGEL